MDDTPTSVALLDRSAATMHTTRVTRDSSNRSTSSGATRAGTEIKTIEVRSGYTEPVSSFDGAYCRGLADPTSPDCRYVFVGPVWYTGTIEGAAWYEMSGPTPAGDHYEGPDIFDNARIEGCGEGGFILDMYEGRIDFANYNPVTNSMPAYNKWRVRPGSGTAGLSGLIGGEGENRFTMYWSETGTQTWGRSEAFDGTITCEVRMNRPGKAGASND